MAIANYIYFHHMTKTPKMWFVKLNKLTQIQN